MLLNLYERFSLIGVLPVEENFEHLRMSFRLKMLLAPTSDENQEFEISRDPNNPGKIMWNEAGNSYQKDVPIDDATMTWLKTIFVDLDAKKKLNDNTWRLYERIVLDYRSGA